MITQNVQKLIVAANAVIDTISVKEALTLFDDPQVALIDVRDTMERAKSGTIPGSTHAPRGFLEFYADPDAAMHQPVFASDKKLVLFCASGGRSALSAKTLVDMGLTNVTHIAGGFASWREAGGPVEAVAAL